MERKIGFTENGIALSLAVTAENEVRLRHLGMQSCADCLERYRPFQSEQFRAVEVQIAGRHHDCGHGVKNMGTSEGKTLRYASHGERYNEFGRLFTLTQKNDAVEVKQRFQFFQGLSVVRTETEVKNIIGKPLPLEYVSSFILYGLERSAVRTGYDGLELNVSMNASYRENQWRSYRLGDLGFVPSSPYSTTADKVCFYNTGTWTCKQHLPMAYLNDTASGQLMLWQIETSGSWSWEIGDYNGCLYLALSGANQSENQWRHTLAPGESFTSVPASLAFSVTGADTMFGEMTQYRRLTRRKCEDTVKLSVVYNPYMHDAGENPSEERILQAVKGVKDLDIDIFCIDAGWHDDGEDYWKAIGSWRESKTRFPSGLNKTLDYIRACGMAPGLWMEPEMMGYYNPEKETLHSGCYFCRGGGVIANNGRQNLDFSRSEVRERLNEILERIMEEYRPGYLKFDYNADAGAGTDANAASCGDGLLLHYRAFEAFVTAFLDRHPGVILESCASGGLRLDPVMLRLASTHSTSDQTDYRLVPYIAGNMLTNGTPEQMAVWCYPLSGQSDEAVIMNVVNTLLGRIQLSGHTPYLPPEKKALVAEGIAYHRNLAKDKACAVPFWPLGLNRFGSGSCCCGLLLDKRAYLAVWNLQSVAQKFILPISAGKIRNVSFGYPKNFAPASVTHTGKEIYLQMPGDCARFLEIELEEKIGVKK